MLSNLKNSLDSTFLIKFAHSREYVPADGTYLD